MVIHFIIGIIIYVIGIIIYVIGIIIYVIGIIIYVIGIIIYVRGQMDKICFHFFTTIHSEFNAKDLPKVYFTFYIVTDSFFRFSTMLPKLIQIIAYYIYLDKCPQKTQFMTEVPRNHLAL